MSVAFANAVVAGLRAHGVVVKFQSGWESRGNGQTSNYQGLIWHHTATGFSVNAPSILVTGRSDLSGPLCNTSGNSDGSVTLVSAGPANHAGASGGRSMGVLPKTGSFNRLVWGHEIVYPGTVPMTDAQYRTATILGAVISKLVGRTDAEACRAHMETSITGKWDPGYANGRTYDMNKFRADTVAVMRGGSGSATSEPVVTKKKVKPVIIERELCKGENYLRIPCMVGSASGLYSRAWVSITGEGGGDMQVAFQKNAASDGPPPGAGALWGPTVFRNASRVFKEIPSGTEFLEVWVTLKGRSGAVAVEFEPKA